MTQVGATSQSFAAIKEDGSVITWGRPHRGGDSSDVANQLLDGVIALADPMAAVPAVVQPPVIEEGTPLALTLSVSPPFGGPQQVTVSFNAQEGKSYRIEASSNLRDWEVLESGITGNGDTIQRSFPAGGATWFLRASEE